ncbi:MAG: GNAT family N-acetyltransferase [Silicimonas sp.]|nr:GNAT family N-acetyltransferase [Silicimonas sp.]
MSSLLDKVDALAGWTAATPGACNGGRAMATDDPDLLGWPVIRAHFEEDGVFVFRHVPTADVARIRDRVADWGGTLHEWRIFHASADRIAANRTPKDAPEGYEFTTEARPDEDTVTEVMSFLSARGLKPFTRRILSGDISPSSLVTARTQDGTLAAVAFGHFCFTPPSIWDGTAWSGLVAVEESARGTGLGRAVSDAAIDAMIGTHGARAVVEYATADNMPSRRMIEGSGLRMRDDILTCAATAGSTPYTR